MAWWKWSLMSVSGSFVCAIAISSTDWIKVMPTTRVAVLPDVFKMFRMGTIFSAVCGILMAYFILTSRLKKPYWADVVFGLLIGTATAIIQARNISLMLVVLHALGFAAAGGGVVALLRLSADIAPGRKMLIWIGLLTLLMSLLITLFDYVPFLNS
jgi:hypothetical protein